MSKLLSPIKALVKKFITFEAPLKTYAREDDFFFVQIGACDGICFDQLHKYIKRYKWPGILVEPVPSLFEELKKNYRSHGNIFFENVAISNKNETKEFYYFKFMNGELPDWYKALGSFSKKHVLGSTSETADRHAKAKNYLVQEKVRCITFKNLLEKHHRTRVSFFQIDTEGFDYEIIKQIDFSTVKPKMIRYEHKHLNPDDKESCENLLENHGYCVLKEGIDTFAFLYPQSGRTRFRLYFEMAISIIWNIVRKSKGLIRHLLEHFIESLIGFFGYEIKHRSRSQKRMRIGNYHIFKISSR